MHRITSQTSQKVWFIRLYLGKSQMRITITAVVLTQLELFDCMSNRYHDISLSN